MRVAINAVSLRKGGTVIAVSRLLSHLIGIAPEHEYHVLADEPLPSMLKLTHSSVIYHRVSWLGGSYARTALWYSFALPFWLRRKSIDVLFSSSCYLPVLTFSRNVLLVQDAKYFFDPTELLKQYSVVDRGSFYLKRLWTHYSVRKADRVLVQTRSLGECIVSQIPSAQDRIATVMHGPGVLDQGTSGYRSRGLSSDSFEIAYVALYRSYKNFRVLLQALALLKTSQIPVRLHLTLDPVDDAGARGVLSYARKIGVEDVIINHGELQPERMSELYSMAHMLVFPSLCESFGFPQVEAMAFGLPLLTSDTPVNREVCAGAAKYFDPDNPRELAAAVEHFYRHPSELSALAERSAERGRNFDWSKAAIETLKCLVGACDPDKR